MGLLKCIDLSSKLDAQQKETLRIRVSELEEEGLTGDAINVAVFDEFVDDILTDLNSLNQQIGLPLVSKDNIIAGKAKQLGVIEKKVREGFQTELAKKENDISELRGSIEKDQAKLDRLNTESEQDRIAQETTGVPGLSRQTIIDKLTELSQQGVLRNPQGGIMSKSEIDSTMVLMDAMAKTWATSTGRKIEEFYNNYLKEVKRGDLNRVGGDLFQKGSIWKSTALEGIKNLQEKANTPAQWMKRISEKGGKGTSQELDWIGLEDFMNEWMKNNNKKSIPKEVVQQYIEDNQIEIVEVTKSDKKEPVEMEWEIVPFEKEDYNAEVKSYEEIIGVIEDKEFGYQIIETDEGYRVRDDDRNTLYEDGNIDKPLFTSLRDAKYTAGIDRFNKQTNMGDSFGTQYSAQTLPGGENYREVLLTLPSKKKINPLHIERDKLSKEYTQLRQEGKDEEANKIDRRISKITKELIKDKAINKTGISNEYKTSHFSEHTNILAHVRIDERTSETGERILMIQEIQSDWAQTGRKEGFKGNVDIRINKDADIFSQVEVYDKTTGKVISAWQTRMDAEQQKSFLNGKSTPDMPFKQTDQWVGLVMRRMMKLAVEEGFDRIAWTTGEQQADINSLSKQVDVIRATKYKDGKWSISADGNIDIAVDIKESELESYIGKDLATKVIKEEEGEDVLEQNIFPDQISSREYRGNDLKAGGEGMKAFYNSIVPKVAMKESQRIDKSVRKETTKINLEEADYNNLTKKVIGKHGFKAEMAEQPSMPITDKMRESLGQITLFQKQKQQGKIKGAISFTQDGRASVELFNGADISTLVHEFAGGHLGRRVAEDIAAADTEFAVKYEKVKVWAGVKNNVWTVESEEKFARAFEKYLLTEEAPTEELKSVFAKLKEWLTEIYTGIRAAAINIEITPEVRDLFDTMLGRIVETTQDTYDQNGEVKFDIVADYVSNKEQTNDSPLTNGEILGVKASFNTQLVTSAELYDRLRELFYPQNLFTINPRMLVASGLYTTQEVAELVKDKASQTKLKEMIYRMNPQITAEFNLSSYNSLLGRFKNPVQTILGKREKADTSLLDYELRKTVGGVKQQVVFELLLSENPHLESVNREYTDNPKFARELREKYQNLDMVSIPVTSVSQFTEELELIPSNGSMLQEFMFFNSHRTQELESVDSPSMRFILGTPQEQLETYSEQVETILEYIHADLLKKYHLNITPLIETAQAGDYTALKTVLEAANTNSFVNVVNAIQQVEKDNLSVQTRSVVTPQMQGDTRNLVYVNDFGWSEGVLYDLGLIRVKQGVYLKVEDASTTELFDKILENRPVTEKTAKISDKLLRVEIFNEINGGVRITESRNEEKIVLQKILAGISPTKQATKQRKALQIKISNLLEVDGIQEQWAEMSAADVINKLESEWYGQDNTTLQEQFEITENGLSQKFVAENQAQLFEEIDPLYGEYFLDNKLNSLSAKSNEKASQEQVDALVSQIKPDLVTKITTNYQEFNINGENFIMVEGTVPVAEENFVMVDNKIYMNVLAYNADFVNGQRTFYARSEVVPSQLLDFKAMEVGVENTRKNALLGLQNNEAIPSEVREGMKDKYKPLKTIPHYKSNEVNNQIKEC